MVGATVQSRAGDNEAGRLPGKKAKLVTHQIALGLDYLWKCGVAHGGEQWSSFVLDWSLREKKRKTNEMADLHSGNVFLEAPKMSSLSERQIKSYLGQPEIAPVRRRDGGLNEPSVPRHLVRPVSFRGVEEQAKIADLGRGV